MSTSTYAVEVIIGTMIMVGGSLMEEAEAEEVKAEVEAEADITNQTKRVAFKDLSASMQIFKQMHLNDMAALWPRCTPTQASQYRITIITIITLLTTIIQTRTATKQAQRDPKQRALKVSRRFLKVPYHSLPKPLFRTRIL
jgi:hypothetical protein